MVATGFQAGLYLILATLLAPEIFGQVSYIVALAGIFAAVSRFGLGNTVTVYQAKNNSTMVNQVNFLALITTGGAALILITIDPYAE